MNEKGMKSAFLFVNQNYLCLHFTHLVFSYTQNINNTHTPSFIMQCMYIDKNKKLTHKKYAFRSFKESKWCGENNRG